MKIKTTARLATVLIIGVAVVYASLVFIINQSVESRYRDFKIASDTLTLVNRLRSLTGDYVMYQPERARQQWWTVQNELLARLHNPGYQAFQKNYQLEDFQAQLQLLGEAFTRLTEAGDKTGVRAPKVEVNQEIRNILITQIELIFREIIRSFTGVSDQIGGDVVLLQRRSTWLDGVALLLLILFILANSLFLQRSVVRPVLQLYEEARIIGQGNLDHRVAPAGSGEIRELFQSFNEMTANLQEVTVSRDELAREMAVRRRAEEAHRVSEERFRAFMDNSPAIAWAKDEAGRHVYLSKAYEDRFRVRWEDWQGKTDFEIWPRETAAVFRANDLKVLAAGQAVEVIEETINPDGKCCYWWNFKFPFYDAAGVRYIGGIGIDITARKQAEEALQESERHFRQVVQSLPQLVWTCQTDGHCDFLSQQWLAFTGIPETEQLGYGWLNQVHPDDRTGLVKTWEASVASGSDFNIEFRIRRHDGNYHWFDTRALPLRGQDGKIVKWFGSNTDIQAQRELREALQQALAKAEAGDSLLTVLMEYVPEGITIADDAGRVAMVSRQGQELLSGLSAGMTLEEITNGWTFYQPDGKTIIAAEDIPIMKAFRAGEVILNQEVVVNNRGMQLPLLCNAAPIRNSAGGIIGSIVAWRDITELKAAEEMLRRSHEELEQQVAARTEDLSRTVDELHKEILQRRQAEGALRESKERLRILAGQLINAQEQERKRLAAELHDELGHSLLILKMALRTIIQNLRPEEEKSKEAIEDQMEYLDNLIEQARRLYYDLSPGELEDLGLNTALENLVEEFAEHHPDITYDVELPELNGLFDLPGQISIYRLMQEALINVGKHAEATELKVWGRLDNQQFRLYIEDNGQGFDVSETNQKFNLGMGLAAMQERLNIINGSLEIESQKGQGTRLIFIIPCREKNI